MVDAIRAAVPGSEFAIETLTGISLEPGYLEPGHAPPGSPRGDLARPVDRAGAQAPGPARVRGPRALPVRVLDAVGDRATATWTVDGLMEISAVGVTKGVALARLCELRGVEARDVVAFGDMPNDLAMLGWAGTSYAVANAHPSVLEAADHVAPANDDDGVASVLATVFGL